MKTIILTLWIICFSVSVHCQAINDNVSPAESQLSKQASEKNFYKIPQLKKWIAENNYKEILSPQTHHVLFRWPLRVNANYDDIPNYYMIQNYVDQVRTTSSKKEWRCGSRTYDGHEGHDINLFPFWWRMKDNKNVFAAAGAPGIVTVVRDSINNDDNCEGDSQGGNYIAILHSDSSTSRYYHIKTGSALVDSGQFVNEGTLLAHIASSGNSSNPHLHFDVRNKDGDWIEPNYSTNPNEECNDLNTDSWWQAQKLYWEPQVNRVMTHSAPPVMQGYVYVNGLYNHSSFCKNAEDAKAKNQFNAGETMVVGIALYSAHPDDTAFITIDYPDNTDFATSYQVIPPISSSRLSRIYIGKSFFIPANAPTGTYTVTVNYKHRIYYDNSTLVTYQVKSYKHFFTVGCTANKTLTGYSYGTTGFIVSNSINSTQLIDGGKSLYQSANYIQLNPGFRATAGVTFKARIRSCNYCD